MGTAQSTQTSFLPLPHQHYSPVEVTPLELQQHKEDEQDKCDKLENCTISFWKMNLLVAWRDMLFVGEANQILVFKLANLRQPWKTITLHGAEINQMRGGLLNGKVPILILVDDAGDVKVVFLENLDRQPLEFSNEVSTWGCAVSQKGLKIAVSANSHNITCWDLQSREKVSCQGHSHNVPCVDWSPCGQFIASASIDTTVRIWHAETGRMIVKKKVCREWGWSCRWVAPHTIKTVAVEPSLWESLHNRLREHFAAPAEEDPDADDDFFDDDEEDLFEEDDESESSQPQSETERNSEAVVGPPSFHNTPTAQTMTSDSQEDEAPDLIDNDERFPNGNEEENSEDDLDESEPDQAVLKRILKLLRSRGKAKQKRQRRNPKEEETLPVIEPPSDFLIFASQHHLFLLNNKLQTVAVLYNAVPRPMIPVPIWMHPMRRISLLEYIPELSLVVVGSQGCASVLLVRIVKNSQTGVFELLPEKALPTTPVASPIAGMWITKHLPNQPGTFHTWNPSLTRRQETAPSTNTENNNNNTFSSSKEDWEDMVDTSVDDTEQFYGGGFCMWRLFILYQNNKIFCYELRRNDSVNNLANLVETFL